MVRTARCTGRVCSTAWAVGTATSRLQAHHTPGPHPRPRGWRRLAGPLQDLLCLLAARTRGAVGDPLHNARRPDLDGLALLLVWPADLKALALLPTRLVSKAGAISCCATSTRSETPCASRRVRVHSHLPLAVHRELHHDTVALLHVGELHLGEIAALS